MFLTQKPGLTTFYYCSDTIEEFDVFVKLI